MSMAGKPSSVVSDHLSRLSVTAELMRFSEQDGQPCMSLFSCTGCGLQHGQVAKPWVSSYLAFPPLPEKSGGISLLHSHWSRLHQPLTGTLPCGARTFLMPKARDHLAISHISQKMWKTLLLLFSHGCLLHEGRRADAHNVLELLGEMVWVCHANLCTNFTDTVFLLLQQ